MKIKSQTIKEQSFCTFMVRGALCGAPVTQVREIVAGHPVTHVPLAHSSVLGLINLRGQILSVIDIGHLMGLAPGPSDQESMRYHVIVEIDDELISLMVDDPGPVVTPAAGEIEPPPSNLEGSTANLITAAARLPNDVLLILDLPRIVELPRTDLIGNES